MLTRHAQMETRLLTLVKDMIIPQKSIVGGSTINGLRPAGLMFGVTGT
jgi:hypothetical protein